ncbi:Gap junction delta-2 protein [Acipenser ruthenus]|uniref:Gap junction protein n=1 Tax=Acipenser ruthenus TaxID=7906 RepID=A0A444UA16_ACIRT|nr:Gap junction delta-2 protein [Acipenser ruthenus]
MGEWTILERLLEAAVQQHSTMIGRILLTVVVIFRILIVAIVGETVYEDEQAMFSCNTLQPGCNQACYDKAFPISHIRYWVFQIILVCTPSLCFITYSVHQAAKQRERRCSFLYPLLERDYGGGAGERTLRKVINGILVQNPDGCGKEELDCLERERRCSFLYPLLERDYGGGAGERTLRKVINGILVQNPDGCGKEELDCLEVKEIPNSPTLGANNSSKSSQSKSRRQEGISRFYVIQVVFRNALEIGFLAGQYFLYGFSVPGRVACDRYPCVKEVECYVSRPTEKTVFLVFMFAVSGVCVLLNLAELNHLGWRKVRTAIHGVQARRKSVCEGGARGGGGGKKDPPPPPPPAAHSLGRTQSSESAYV